MVKNKMFLKRAGAVFADQFKARGDVNVHAHPNLELILVSRGVCRSCIGSLPEISAGAGECFVIPPLVPHDQKGDCDTCFVSLDVEESEVPQLPELIDLTRDEFCHNLFFELVSCFKRESEKEVDTLAAALWCRLRERHLKAGEHISPSSVYTDIAVDYIHRHYREALGVETLAREAQISPAHLNRFFHQEYGMSTMQYLYNWRLKVACRLLESPYFNISEVAVECGFSSANYFIRAFRKKYGTTPGKIKKSAGAKLA
jgi:AraC-like DNA-binding protein